MTRHSLIQATSLQVATLKNPPPATSANLGSVQGRQHESQAECKCYTNCPLLTNSPEVKDRLAKVTEPRNYSLFLLEKAAKYLIDDVWSPPKRRRRHDENASSHVESTVVDNSKEKLVVLGAGWGSAAFLKSIDTDRYDGTVISPRNYFLFTPMLAGSAVGTVDVRSITRPIREFNLGATYLEAAATKIDINKRLIQCTSVATDTSGPSSGTNLEVPYDRLIVAVGARSNTFGIPGVEEHCLFLKEASDSQSIRRKVVDLFEKASLPGQPQEEIRKLLTFAVIGAGPTGTEFTAELADFVEQDGPRFYPKLLKYVQIHLIEASPTVLRPFAESLQKAAMDALTETPKDKSLFSGAITQLDLNKKVKRVTKDYIELEGNVRLPYGLAVWAGGIGPLPITLDLIAMIGGRQVTNQNVARGKLAVDPWLRVIDGKGKIFALGDCACNQGGPLAATAQVAAQQGEFLAHTLNVGNHTIDFENGVQLPPKRIDSRIQLHDHVASIATGEYEYLAPFQYLDLGILAYTGHYSALAQVQMTPSKASQIRSKGRLGFGLWRSIYLAKQTSFRNQLQVAFDWTKAQVFGRDITRLE
jgi:NADH dehydrogenase FAD-containing subunit